MSIFCYQHHINDWRRDTSDLTIEQKGAYRELLDWYYFTDGKLTSDLKSLYRILSVQTPRERRAIAFIVSKFFKISSNFELIQKRSDDEIEKIHNKSMKAKSSVEHRYNNDLASTNVDRTYNERSTNQEPRTKNQEPSLYINGVKNGKFRKKPSSGQEAADQWIEENCPSLVRS